MFSFRFVIIYSFGWGNLEDEARTRNFDYNADVFPIKLLPKPGQLPPSDFLPVFPPNPGLF